MEININGCNVCGLDEIKIDIDKMSIEDYNKFLARYNLYHHMFEDTMDFQKKYGLWDENVYGFLDDDKMKVKIGHLIEELNEIQNAYTNRDLAEFADGILDLVYVALGTLNLMNMPVKQLWNDIQIRNMAKIRATSDNMGKRGSTFDVIKPEGWTGPRTTEIIEFNKPTSDSTSSK